MSAFSGRMALLFSGGGSQKVGMGASLSDTCDDCRATIAQADEALGMPLSRIMFEGPRQELEPAAISHPAVLALSVAQARHLKADGIAPDAVVGHSLGQYSALVAAGALEYRTAVRLVAERARLMQEAVPQGTGAMMAIVGLERQAIYDACAQVRSAGVANVACHNSPSQTVISGERVAVEAAAAICEEAGGGAVMLPISVASHCDLLAAIHAPMAELVEAAGIVDPEIPVVDNVTAEPLMDAESIRHALIAQLTRPVLFEESLRYLEHRNYGLFIECGPGKSLIELAKRVTPGVQLQHFEGTTRDRVAA